MERYKHYTDASRIILPVVDVLIIFGAFRLTGFFLFDNWTFNSY